MDDNVIDTLRIEIEADSTNAVNGIDQLIAALERVRAATQNATPANFEGVAEGVNEQISGFEQMEERIEAATEATRQLGNATQNINVDQFVRSKSEVDLLKMKLDEAKQKLQELLNSGETDSGAVANLTQRIQTLQSKIEAATSKTSIFKSMLSGVGKVAKTAGSGLLKMAGAPFNALGKAVGGLKEKFGGFLTMFKKRLLYRVINGIISACTKAIKEGVNNVYQYSKAFGGTFSKSMDRAATSLLYFKNSLGAMAAPLINMLIPALEWVVNKVVDFVNVLNQLFAKLSGASTWTRAIMYPKEYAENTNEATAANKKFKASILGIDELNVMQDNSSSAGGGSQNGDDYSQMFEEVALDGSSLFGDFFKPFKEAWENEGMNTINAIKRMFGGFKGLFQSIGRSFNEVWQNGTGQRSLEIILGITQGIARFWGNIANSIKRAWDKNGTGTRIAQALWNIFNSILGTCLRIVNATADWAANLNFSPLLEAIAGFLEKIKPLIDIIGRVIEWIWVNIVLPVCKWLIEGILPDIINGLGGICDFLVGVFTGDWEKAWNGIETLIVSIWDSIWTHTLQPVVMWIYEEILVPIGNFFEETWNSIKELVIGAWESICDVWDTVSTWFDENVIQPVVDFFKGLWESVSGFFVNLWNDVRGIWETVSDWYNNNVVQPVVNFFSGLWESVSGFFSGLWDDIKNIWNTVSTWFEENVTQPVSDLFEGLWGSVSGFFTTLWDDIRGVWESVATWFNENVILPISGFFESLWGGIKGVINHILGGIESFVNFFVDAINWIIRGLNKISFDIPDWVPLIGGKTFGFNLSEVNKVTLPRLSEGGMLTAGTMFIAGEAGAEVVGQVGRRTGVMNTDEMRESVAQGVVDANREQNALLREEIDVLKQILAKDWDVTTYVTTGNIIDGLTRKNRRDGKTAVPVGV